MCRKAGANSEFDHLLVQDRQDAGKTRADGAGVTIGFAAELGRAATKNFRLREQLGVNFESNDGFVFHGNLKIGPFLMPRRRLLIGVRYAKDCRFVERLADDLQSDGKTGCIETTGEGKGW